MIVPVRHGLVLLAAAGVGACLASGLAAQRDTMAVLSGTVFSAYTGRPLPGVAVSLPLGGALATTGEDGRFLLSRIPPGKQPFRVVYRERLEVTRDIELSPGRTTQISIVLNVDAVALPAIEVVGEGHWSRYDLTGFYERRRMGFGKYFTFEDLDRRGALALRALLIEAGLDVSCTIRGCQVRDPVRGCAVPIYVDGHLWPSEDINWIRADLLAGLEVYRRGVGVPVEYVSTMENCGVVVAWSRY